ncbi:MAG: hypothetical protein ACR5LD_01490 [Symbiopectobacterium sp.]
MGAQRCTRSSGNNDNRNHYGGQCDKTPMTATQSTLYTLFQPALETNERQLLLDYSENRFNAGVQTPLTQPQLNELVTFYSLTVCSALPTGK